MFQIELTKRVQQNVVMYVQNVFLTLCQFLRREQRFFYIKLTLPLHFMQSNKTTQCYVGAGFVL